MLKVVTVCSGIGAPVFRMSLPVSVRLTRRQYSRIARYTELEKVRISAV